MQSFFISPVSSRPALYSCKGIQHVISTRHRRSSYIVQLLKLNIIIHEVLQVIVGHVDVRIAPQSAVLFNRLAASAECVSVDLVLDLVWRVGKEDRALDNGSRHLALWALQGGEEFRVHECWLRVLELAGYVTRQSEVWVLIDRTWNEARHVVVGTEDLRE